MNLDEGPNRPNRGRRQLTCPLGAVAVLGESPKWDFRERESDRKERQQETKDRFKTLQSISDLTQG